jgi:hypothetical protein
MNIAIVIIIIIIMIICIHTRTAYDLMANRLIGEGQLI